MTDVKSTEQSIIKVRDLHKFFGPTHVIKGVDLDVLHGEVVLIMGPLGGRNSTFLPYLNFLDEPSAGKIEIDGAGIHTRGPAR